MDDESVTLRDYTEAFKVKKALRKVGKANVPLKEGLFVDDIKVFGITFVVWTLAYSIVLAPPIKLAASLFGLQAPTGVIYLIILFAPPLCAAIASRRPVRHNLGIFGLMRAAWRDTMDDPVHRKGVPVRKGHGAGGYRIVLWRARPDLLPQLAPVRPLPNGFNTVSPPAAVPGRQLQPGTAVESVPAAHGEGEPTQLSDQDLTADYVISTRRA